MTTDPPRLVIRLVNERGDLLSYELGKRPVVIGSATNAHIQLTGKNIADQHLVILHSGGEIVIVDPGGGEIVIVDPGSSSGVLLNGRRIPPNQKIRWSPGDTLSIDRYRLSLLPQVAGAADEVAEGPGGDLRLTVEPPVIYAPLPATLQLHHAGTETRQVFFEAVADSPNLAIDLEWRSIWSQRRPSLPPVRTPVCRFWPIRSGRSPLADGYGLPSLPSRRTVWLPARGR